MQREPGYAARPEAKWETVLGWLLGDGDLFAPGNPSSRREKWPSPRRSQPFPCGLAASPEGFLVTRRVLGRRGGGHRAGRYIWSTEAAYAEFGGSRTIGSAGALPAGAFRCAAQQRSWALHSREKPSTEVASSGILPGPVSTCLSQ